MLACITDVYQKSRAYKYLFLKCVNLQDAIVSTDEIFIDLGLHALFPRITGGLQKYICESIICSSQRLHPNFS